MASIGDKPDETNEEKRQHTFLIYLAVLMSSGGSIWGTIALLSDLFYQAMIPYTYIIITVLNLSYLYFTKDFKRVQAIQLFISLMLPFAFHMSLGGFVASGAMVLWSVIAVFAAFTYKENYTIIVWFILFIILIIISGLVDDFATSYMPAVPKDISILFFVLNIIMVSFIIFTLFYYFVGSEKKFRHSLEENLVYIQEAQAQLVESEKMVSLGRLVAGVAHEINTPIGVSVTAASHLDKTCTDFVKLYEAQQVKKSDFDNFILVANQSNKLILHNLDRAAVLIRSFKSISVDQSSGELREINIKEYTESIILSLNTKMKKTNHSIYLECPDSFLLTIQAGSFAQVVSNLIENSLTHAFVDEDMGEIKIRIEAEKEGILMNYEDNGKGLSAQGIKRFFEPFYTTNRANGGSGLGTHIVYNLVTHTLQGSIELLSKENEGFHVLIHIPKMEVKHV